jgi:hypothetical protein
MVSPNNAYEHPPTVATLAPVPLRTLLPLSEPSSSEAPALPSSPRQPSFSGKYKLSTHLVPSAHPRSTPDTPCPNPPPASGSDRQAGIERIAKELLANSVLHAQGRLNGENSTKQLWNCVNCYRRQGPQQGNVHGLTLFFAHANGFPKEVRAVSYQHMKRSSLINMDRFGSLRWSTSLAIWKHPRAVFRLTRSGLGRPCSMATLHS